MIQMSRRRFLRLTGVLGSVLAGGAAGVLGGCTSSQPTSAEPEGSAPAAAAPAAASPPTVTTDDPNSTVAAAVAATGLVPDVEIALKAVSTEVSVMPGQPTQVAVYQGELLRGDPANLQPIPDSYLGPTIRVRKGQRLRVHFTNGLDQPSIIHWHGQRVPPEMDGHPQDAVEPGRTYIYEFAVLNRAGTYWYHPHPHTLTAPQAYRGLAGLLLVSDEEEDAAGLPSGEYDLPLVIQDRTFDANNQLVYVQNEMERMMGFLGDRILVNGRPDYELAVATRAYRLRLLNGSNSRVYKLAWDDNTPLTVIATDGGLLEQAVQRPCVTLGPGERVELWADFSRRPVGDELTLQSLAFLGAEGDTLVGEGMGHGMDHGAGHMGHSAPATAEAMEGHMGHGQAAATATPEASGGHMGHETTPLSTPESRMEALMAGMAYNPALPNGAPFPVLKVRVERQAQAQTDLPTTLSTIERYRLEDAANVGAPRSFGLSLRHMTWLLNGRPFEMTGVAENEVTKLGRLEVWEFINELNPGEMMDQMGMVHPMHIHGVQFQIVERQVMVPELAAGFDSVREGYVDAGWKDTLLVMPGERVRLLVKFQDYPGLFVYHCHNLEHEDMGMMRNYLIEG